MIAVLAVAAAAIIYYFYEPRLNSFYPACPLHYITGLKCPFCGVQQMVYHLLHGQVKAAFLTNSFLFLLIPYSAAYFYFTVFGKEEKHARVYRALYGNKTLLALSLIAIAFGIVRNLI